MQFTKRTTILAAVGILAYISLAGYHSHLKKRYAGEEIQQKEKAAVIYQQDQSVASAKAVETELEDVQVQLSEELNTSSVYSPRSNSSYSNSYSDSTGRQKTVHVRGYYRKDGTYVNSHLRSAPKR